MRGYAETTDCRRHYVLNYFGEDTDAQHCNHCDNDLTAAGMQRVVVTAAQMSSTLFAVGEQVQHEAWGVGTVQRVSGDHVTVLFETVGYKTLAASVVQEHGLMRAA